MPQPGWPEVKTWLEAELASVQQEDGSWGWFYLPDASSDKRGFRKSVYMTAYVLKALTE